MSDPKTIPFSDQAEWAVLGGVMIHAPALDDVADMLREEDFYRADHQAIWRTIIELDGQSKPFDVVHLAEYMQNRATLDAVGGIGYLGRLASNCPSVANIRRYAEIVSDRARERRALNALVMADGEIRGDGETDDKLDRAQALLSEAAEKRSKTGPQVAADLLPQWVDALEERHNRGGDVIGLRTGFDDIDRITAGLQDSDLIIIAGRPSMGKTTFALNIGENVALFGLPVLVFSMEMPSEQLLSKNHASVGNVPLDAIRRGDLNDEQWSRLTVAVGRIKQAPLFYDDTPALSTVEMRARARRIKRKHGLKLIIVDYLQLMRSTSRNKNGTREGEVSEISRGLKALAKELRVPVIALSQLSRDVEKRPNKRPNNSDLRDSGAIEQDADVIAFVYRDEVYNQESADKGTAEILITKQRNGATGMIRLVTRLDVSRFESMAYNDRWSGA